MSRFHVPGGDYELYYEEIGSGPTWITLIHGGLVDARSWGKLPKLLESLGRVLTFDVRGFGRSDKPASGYSLAGSVSDMTALWDHVGVASSHVLGFSQGGVTAQSAAITCPERVESLLTLGTFATRTEAERAGARARADDAVQNGIATQVGVHIERVFSAAFREDNPELVKKYLEPFAENDAQSFAATMRFMADVDLVAALSRIHAPTTVVVGSEDVAVGVEPSRLIHASIPGSRLVIVPGAGHTVHIEQPERFAAIVTEHVEWAQALAAE